MVIMGCGRLVVVVLVVLLNVILSNNNEEKDGDEERIRQELVERSATVNPSFWLFGVCFLEMVLRWKKMLIGSPATSHQSPKKAFTLSKRLQWLSGATMM